MNHLARPVASRVACRASFIRALSTTLQLARKNAVRAFTFRGRHEARKARLDASMGEAEGPEKPGHPRGNLRSLQMDFQQTVMNRFSRILKTENLKGSSQADQGMLPLLKTYALAFSEELNHAFDLASDGIVKQKDNPLYVTLRDAFTRGDKLHEFDRDLYHEFQSFIARRRFSEDVDESMRKLADLRFPHEFFPATRALQRTIHVHVGPTNSGKTYNALKALENAKSGLYAGPLRLLANEVYQRLMAKGHPCALITGEEVRTPSDTDRFFVSCTVEMLPLNNRYDVAVIDEIQMIENDERGSAWTNALLGVQAKEVHVCGEDRSVDLIRSLCATVGDKVVIHRYERLSPLETMPHAVGHNFNKLQKGDAIVAFSRLNLHAYKQRIERATGRRCAIIYGSLPPDVRVSQAALFNNPDNDYDYIVASDAIGMGLNLEIRRVIFSDVTKFDGHGRRHLSAPELRQIGGRAGRYRTAANATGATTASDEPKVGLVTTLNPADIKRVGRLIKSRPQYIKQACLFPPAGIIERFASYFPPGTPLSWIMHCIQAIATVSPMYQLHVPRDVMRIADELQDLPLTIFDRLTFCNLPCNLRSTGSSGSADSIGSKVLRALATIVAEHKVGHILSIPEIPLEFLELDMKDFVGEGAHGEPLEYLSKMEVLHDAVNQYVWLSYRFTGMFPSRPLAFHIRSLVEQRLTEALSGMDFTDTKANALRRERWMERMRHKQAEGEGFVEEGNAHELDDVNFDVSLLGGDSSSTPSVDEEVGSTMTR